MPEFHRACAAGDVLPGRMKRVEVDETPICLYNIGGQLYATHDTCSHAEASLAEGFLDPDACSVECPLHGARFDVKTGKALCLPAVSPVKTYAVEVRDGEVFVRV